MLSEMAAEDIKYLEGLGVTLTPGQILDVLGSHCGQHCTSPPC